MSVYVCLCMYVSYVCARMLGGIAILKLRVPDGAATTIFFSAQQCCSRSKARSKAGTMKDQARRREVGHQVVAIELLGEARRRAIVGETVAASTKFACAGRFYLGGRAANRGEGKVS